MDVVVKESLRFHGNAEFSFADYAGEIVESVRTAGEIGDKRIALLAEIARIEEDLNPRSIRDSPKRMTLQLMRAIIEESDRLDLNGTLQRIGGQEFGKLDNLNAGLGNFVRGVLRVGEPSYDSMTISAMVDSIIKSIRADYNTIYAIVNGFVN